MCYGKIYYITKQDIHPEQELFVFYGNTYAKTLNISMTSYYEPLGGERKKVNCSLNHCWYFVVIVYELCHKYFTSILLKY